jgi:hypothetical protein
LASASGAAGFEGSSSAYLKVSQLNVQSNEIDGENMDSKYRGILSVWPVVGGKDWIKSQVSGMSNSQIGEEILFEVIRFRHFGSILCFGE